MFTIDLRAEAEAIGSCKPAPSSCLPLHALDELLQRCDDRCGKRDVVADVGDGDGHRDASGEEEEEEEEEERREIAAAAAALRERIEAFARTSASVDSARAQSARAALMGR